jgi:hypothetical protein
MEVNGQLHALAALPRGESRRYPLNMILGGRQGPYESCGAQRKYLASAENGTRAIQPVANRDTYWTIPRIFMKYV